MLRSEEQKANAEFNKLKKSDVAETASQEHAKAIAAAEETKDELDTTNAIIKQQISSNQLNPTKPLDRIAHIFDIYKEHATGQKFLHCVAEFDVDGKFTSVIDTWTMEASPKGINTLDDFNNPEGVFPLPVLKMLLIQHAEVQDKFHDKLVQCFDIKESSTGTPRISGEQAEWLISRVPEEDRVSHPLREVEKGDGPANRSQEICLVRNACISSNRL